MHRNRMTWMAATLGVAAIGLVGCGKDKIGDLGAASVSVKALSIADIDNVTVTVQGASMPSALTVPLVKKGAQFSAVVSSLPVGTNYSFTASAKDASNVELYSGSVMSQTITKNQTANIVINMNQNAGPVPLVNEAPVIDSLTATSLLVAYNDTVTLSASAHDPDAGDTAGMDWVWEASAGCGTLGTPTNTTGNDTTPGTSTVVWTSPSVDGNCTISLTVKDAKNPVWLQTKASLIIQVNLASGSGNAKITALPNTCPVIGNLYAAPVPLKTSVATTLTVLSTDADGDGMTYAWTSPDCGTLGSFGSANQNETTFTLTSAPTNLNCTFLVVVTDGTFPNGAAKCSIQNHLSLPVSGPGDTVVGSAIFGYDYQSSDTLANDEVVKLEIVAPTNCPAVLAWASSDGQALTPLATLDPPFTSGVTYEAGPDAANGNVVTVTVTATCPGAVAPTSHAFTLVPLNSFCFGKNDGTDCTTVASDTNKCILAASCVAGVCVTQTSRICDPSTDQCKDNVCAPDSGDCGLVNKTPGTSCNDGLNCTSVDVCNAGACQGAATPCDQTGVAECKVKACSESDGLCHVVDGPNGTSCDDTNGCSGASTVTDGTSNGADTCQSGACSGPAATCTAPLAACTSTSPSTGVCSVPACLDSNVYARKWSPLMRGISVGPDALASGVQAVWAVGGVYQPGFDFGSGLLTISETASSDIFLTKINPATGLATDAFAFGDASGNDQYAIGLAVASSGNVGFLGKFKGEVDIGPDENNSGVSGKDWLSYTGITPISFYAVIDGTATGTRAGIPSTKTIKARKMQLGEAGAILAVGSNPNRNEIVFCGSASELVGASTTTTGLLLAPAGSPANPTALNNGETGGTLDLVVVKIDASNGNIVWGRQYGGAGDQNCESIALDNNGDVVIAGNYNGNLLGLPNVADTSGTTAVVFVATLASETGALVQAATWGGTGRSDAYSVAVDGTTTAAGNIIVAGALGGNVTIGGSIGTLTDVGLTDAFVLKLTPTLSPVWGKSFGDQPGDTALFDQSASAVATNAAGDAIVGGSFIRKLYGTGLTSVNTSASDAYVLRLAAADGAVTCAHSYGDGAGTHGVTAILDARTAGDATFMGGIFSGEMPLLPAGTLSSGSTAATNTYFTRLTP